MHFRLTGQRFALLTRGNFRFVDLQEEGNRVHTHRARGTGSEHWQLRNQFIVLFLVIPSGVVCVFVVLTSMYASTMNAVHTLKTMSTEMA
jgi:hypothetical protein